MHGHMPIHEHGPNAPTIDTGTPVPVAIDFVDSQLTDLWRHVAEVAHVKGGSTGVTMAQVLNLIVKTNLYATANQCTNEIDSITGSHPSRVIMMIIDPAGDEMPVQAWVSIHCQLPPSGGRQVCAEQISVAAGGNAVRQVPAAVIPLLCQDLPVFLWWPEGSPFDDYLFRQLADSLNRLIVDSATFENPEGTLAKMSTRLKNEWPNIACTDVNWGRLTRWRELAAQFFDRSTLRPYLDRIGRVTIAFALSERGTVNRAQALMVAGWLASRLGWKPVAPVYEMLRADGNGPPTARLTLQSSGRPVTIMLQSSDKPSSIPGDIHTIRLEVPGTEPDGPPEACFEVTLCEENNCASMTAEVQGVNPSSRNVPLETQDRASLLDEELDVFSRDRIYEETLDIVGVFIRGIEQSDEDGTRKISSGEPVSAGGHRARPPQGTKHNDK